MVLAGRGPELGRLRYAAAAARVPVPFVDRPSAALLRALYQQAAVFVFPAIEDFGIMPVEAMAAGAPVLAQEMGGTAESVVPGLTGALCTSPRAPRCGRASRPRWRRTAPTDSGTPAPSGPSASARRSAPG